ncbi:MAG TPA: hypothetical protein VF319_00595 [Caldimonas sp.]
MASVRWAIVGVCAAWLVGSVAPALAQPRVLDAWGSSSVRVEGFDVEQVPRLAPGTRLEFTLFGTPGAAATLQIEGAAGPLDLSESQAGIYEGSYTIGPHERIDPEARVTAALRRGDLVARALLEEPLVLGAKLPPWALSRSSRPRDPSSRAAESEGSLRPVPLQREVGSVPVDESPPLQAACVNCAVVESVRVVEPARRPGIVGAIAGGLAGMLVGNQVGQGPGRHIARIIGALGGAWVGHEIAHGATGPVRYDVWLHLPNGTTQIRSYQNPPPYKTGDVVRVAPPTFTRASRSAAPF